MRHIISVLLENESGALSRVSGLFSARGYNIESLTVAPTHDSSLSRMTIVTHGNERRIDQIEKHLFKLIDVAALQDITIFNGQLIDVSDHRYVVELSGSSEKIDELVKALASFQIVETARSGVTGLAFSEKSLSIE